MLGFGSGSVLGGRLAFPDPGEFACDGSVYRALSDAGSTEIRDLAFILGIPVIKVKLAGEGSWLLATCRGHVFPTFSHLLVCRPAC